MSFGRSFRKFRLLAVLVFAFGFKYDYCFGNTYNVVIESIKIFKSIDENYIDYEHQIGKIIEDAKKNGKLFDLLSKTRYGKTPLQTACEKWNKAKNNQNARPAKCIIAPLFNQLIDATRNLTNGATTMKQVWDVINFQTTRAILDELYKDWHGIEWLFLTHYDHNTNNMNILHWATALGNLDCVKFIKEKNTNWDDYKKLPTGTNANWTDISTKIDGIEKVNIQDTPGNKTALWLAEAMLWILDKNKKLGIHFAGEDNYYYRYTEIIKLLTANNSDPNGENGLVEFLNLNKMAIPTGLTSLNSHPQTNNVNQPQSCPVGNPSQPPQSPNSATNQQSQPSTASSQSQSPQPTNPAANPQPQTNNVNQPQPGPVSNPSQPPQPTNPATNQQPQANKVSKPKTAVNEMNIFKAIFDQKTVRLNVILEETKAQDPSLRKLYSLLIETKSRNWKDSNYNNLTPLAFALKRANNDRNNIIYLVVKFNLQNLWHATAKNLATGRTWMENIWTQIDTNDKKMFLINPGGGMNILHKTAAQGNLQCVEFIKEKFGEIGQNSQYAWSKYSDYNTSTNAGWKNITINGIDNSKIPDSPGNKSAVWLAETMQRFLDTQSQDFAEKQTYRQRYAKIIELLKR